MCFGQNSGHITYEVSLTNQHTPKTSNTTVRNLLKNAKNVHFKLSFNTTESLYLQEKKLETDQSNTINIVKILAGGNGVFYYNTKKKHLIHKMNLGADTFLIKKEPSQWKITKDSKHIGKYFCLKAILLDTNKTETNTLAWFTPEISVSFGPNFYNNLPGLILIVVDNKMTYVAKTIELSKASISIEPPTAGIPITQKEFRQRFSGFFNKD
jgi:GLPGLI family protein